MKFRKKLITCLALLVSAFSHNPINAEIQTLPKQSYLENGSKTVEVFSYKDVLFKYYFQALTAKNSVGSAFVEFDEFCNQYYENNINIQEYTESWKYIDTNNYIGYSYESSKPAVMTNSVDEKYILDSKEYDITPKSVFKRDIIDNHGLFVDVRPGDIVYETKTKLWNAGHVALVTQTNKRVEGYSKTYIETIEAVGGGVQHGFLDDERITKFGVKVLRIHTNMSQFAIDFIKKQLGKKYSLNPNRKNTSVDSKEWYCSELVWAAYLSAGIDICTINRKPIGSTGNSGGPLPYGIYVGDFTSVLPLCDYFIRFLNKGKTNGTWKIQLVNFNSFEKDVKFNKKMCFLDDCIQWDKLKDLEKAHIDGYGSTTAEIKENWFATAIVCGWESGDTNYVTYADGLNENSEGVMYRYAIL